jgi:GNAT superfamily N-acetyltransferase
MAATKQHGKVALYEIEGLDMTTTRVFAAYQRGINLGWLTIDDAMNTIELVYVPDFLRGEGIATVLLDFAREVTGLSLDQDTGERTLEGSRWARARGIKIAPGSRYRRLAKREIARQIGVLSMVLMNEPPTEET